MPEVQRVAAVYEGKVRWVNDAAGQVRDIFVIGFNPSEDIFDLPEVEAQLQTLSRTDTILVDREVVRSLDRWSRIGRSRSIRGPLSLEEPTVSGPGSWHWEPLGSTI